MPKLNPQKQIAHALAQLQQGHRLAQAGSKALQRALKALTEQRKAQGTGSATTATAGPGGPG